MFNPSEEAKRNLKSLNANVRYSRSAQTFTMKNDKLVLDPEKPGEILCEVQDKETSEWYCSADGPDESAALDNALRLAIRTPKPMTKAQKATFEHVETIVKSKDEEIVSQRAEIEALKAQLAAAPVKKGPFGRPLKPKPSEALATSDSSGAMSA